VSDLCLAAPSVLHAGGAVAVARTQGLPWPIAKGCDICDLNHY